MITGWDQGCLGMALVSPQHKLGTPMSCCRCGGVAAQAPGNGHFPSNADARWPIRTCKTMVVFTKAHTREQMHHVNMVSRCWQGEVRNLDIPADEGYGKSGFPAWGIPPNGGLLFEIEVRARACLPPLLGFHPCSDFIGAESEFVV